VCFTETGRKGPGWLSAGLWVFLLAGTMLLSGACGELLDDLNPSGDDKRSVYDAGTTGPYVGQTAPEFTVPDSLGVPVTLSSQLAVADAVVLYFTMWCPICEVHMSHLRQHVVGSYPTVSFFLVDFVSGSVSKSRLAQVSYGYTDFTVLADADVAVMDAYNGGMGITALIGSDGVIRLNEDYKDGFRLKEALDALLAAP